MTEFEMKRMLEAIEKTDAELSKSKEATWEFLIRAGIETEESRRKHEEKEKKGRSKK